MEKKYFIPTALIASMLLCATLVTALGSKSENLSMADSGLSILGLSSSEVEELKSMVPKTFEEAEAEILPINNRYLMWTHDGKHIMWGTYGRKYFVGTDNLGKKAWGVYSNGLFAGFYDGDLFIGRYSRRYWRAFNLFGLKYSRGGYLTFPSVTATPAEIATEA